jgi:hypothetical protein
MTNKPSLSEIPTEETREAHFDAIIASTRKLEEDILAAEIELNTMNPTIH